MTPNAEIWIAVFVCLLVGTVSCLTSICLIYKLTRQSRGVATLIGVFVFAGLLGMGGYLAVTAQPEPGAAFAMMFGAFLTLLLGLIAGPLAFLAVRRKADS